MLCEIIIANNSKNQTCHWISQKNMPDCSLQGHPRYGPLGTWYRFLVQDLIIQYIERIKVRIKTIFWSSGLSEYSFKSRREIPDRLKIVIFIFSILKYVPDHVSNQHKFRHKILTNEILTNEIVSQTVPYGKSYSLLRNYPYLGIVYKIINIAKWIVDLNLWFIRKSCFLAFLNSLSENRMENFFCNF